MQKKFFILSLLSLFFCLNIGLSQVSPIPGVAPVLVDSSTHFRILGGYRSENNISFYEPTTGNLLVTYYYLAPSGEADRRRITASVSTDNGSSWTVYKDINSGVGSEMNASYPVANGNATTPIVVYYNSANPDVNINKQPILATDLMGWGGGLWDNQAVDAIGTADTVLDFRYNSMAIAPDNPDLWLISGAQYEPGNCINIYRSTNGGVNWGRQIQVATTILADSLKPNYVYAFTGNKQPLAISAGANNKVYGAFQAQMESAFDIERLVYVTSNDGGLTWTDPAFIPGTESLMFSTADVYRNFSTLIDAAGNWHVFAIGEDTTEAANSYRIWDFRFNGSDWNINKFGFPQMLNEGIAQPGLTNSDEEDVMNSPAIGPDGTLYYAYTDVVDTTGAGGDPHLYQYRIFVMISQDNGTTWQGPQWIFEDADWASDYPCDMTRTASDKLHFFYRKGGSYDEYKELNYLGVPTQGIKDLIVSLPEPAISNIPKSHKLFQNFPNPFNPNTTIRFNLKENVHVKLMVYNLLGQKIATLIDKKMVAGEKGIVWYAKGIPSGTYFYRLEAGDYSEVKEMILIK